MSSYICGRCGFETSRKLNLKRHLFRKRICEPMNSGVSIKSIAESYGIELPSTEKLSVTPNVNPNDGFTVTRQPNTKTITSPISPKHIANVNPQYKCIHCSKTFTTRQGKYKHKKHCKHIKNKTTYTQEEVEQKLKEARKESDRKIKEVEEKYEVLADKKAQKMVLSIVDKLIPNQTTTQTTNNHNNSHNNIQNNNTLINNNNNNLKINNFGKEKTKYITDANLKIMFVDPRNAIVQHIKDTYYHVFHPENFNAKITNCKSKHMHILKENEWEKVNKQLTICSMYNKHEKIIESEFERLKPELTDTVKDNYKEYKQSTLHSFNIFKHRMVDIEAVIINGTKRHKQIDLLSEKEVARLAKEQNKTPGDIFAEHMPDIFAEREDS
jgi:DNA-directed RNA polymerase subunit RPC12/RpoP